MTTGTRPLAPFVKAAAITPNDSTDLPTKPCLAIYVGGAGAVKAILADDTEAVTFVAVPVGTVLHVRATRVLSTGTTATNLVALY
jgi:hypothetical protein